VEIDGLHGKKTLGIYQAPNHPLQDQMFYEVNQTDASFFQQLSIKAIDQHKTIAYTAQPRASADTTYNS